MLPDNLSFFTVCASDTVGRDPLSGKLNVNDINNDCQVRVATTFAVMADACAALRLGRSEMRCSCGCPRGSSRPVRRRDRLPRVTRWKCRSPTARTSIRSTPRRARPHCPQEGTTGATSRCASWPPRPPLRVTSRPPRTAHHDAHADGRGPVRPAFHLCPRPGAVYRHVTLDGEIREPSVSGVVEFLGAPCPGAACAVGMTYQLDLAPLVSPPSVPAPRSRTCAPWGRPASGAVALDANGVALIAAGQTLTSARGTRKDSGFCISNQVVQMSFVGTNGDPVAVTADWAAKTCTVNGATRSARRSRITMR